MPTSKIGGVRVSGSEGSEHDVIDIDVSGGGLKFNDTTVTVTAAELNALDGITSTYQELNENDNMTSRAQSTVAVAAEAGDAIAVTITLKDAAGTAISGARPFFCWLSSSATTGALATDDGITVTATTGILLKEHTDDLIFHVVSSTAGVAVLSIAAAGAAGPHFLWIDFPGRAPLVSGAITLAA